MTVNEFKRAISSDIHTHIHICIDEQLLSGSHTLSFPPVSHSFSFIISLSAKTFAHIVCIAHGIITKFNSIASLEIVFANTHLNEVESDADGWQWYGVKSRYGGICVMQMKAEQNAPQSTFRGVHVEALICACIQMLSFSKCNIHFRLDYHHQCRIVRVVFGLWNSACRWNVKNYSHRSHRAIYFT